MPNKANESNSTLGSTGSGDRVVVTDLRGEWDPPRINEKTHRLSLLESTPQLTTKTRVQWRPSLATPRRRPQPRGPNLRWNKTGRLGQTTLEVISFLPFSFFFLSSFFLFIFSFFIIVCFNMHTYPWRATLYCWSVRVEVIVLEEYPRGPKVRRWSAGLATPYDWLDRLPTDLL